MADTELNLIEKAVMDVVLSREGRRRYNKGDSLTLDPSDLRDIVRLTMAKCATTPSPSTAPEAWVYECKQPHTDPVIWAEFFSRDKPSDAPYIRNARPLYGAALAPRPAEVDDEGLPPLPEPFENWDPRYEGADCPVFTAEQYRQGQRDAVAADRARRGLIGVVTDIQTTEWASRPHGRAVITCGLTVRSAELWTPGRLWLIDPSKLRMPARGPA